MSEHRPIIHFGSPPGTQFAATEFRPVSHILLPGDPLPEPTDPEGNTP